MTISFHTAHYERSLKQDYEYYGEGLFRPLSINTILYMDDMTDESGPTYVVPGTHRGEKLPPAGEAKHKPLENEVPVYAEAGDGVFINGAIWHSGGINRGDGLRRGKFTFITAIGG